MGSLKLNNYIKKRRSAFLISVTLLLLGVALITVISNKKTADNRNVAFFPADTYIPNQLVIKYRLGQSPDELKNSTGKYEEGQKTFSGSISNLFNEKILSHKSPKQLRQEEQAADVEAGVVEKKKIFTSANPLLTGYYLLTLKPGSNVIETEKFYIKYNFIDKVQPNFFFQTHDIVPNDQFYSQLWDRQKIQMPEAWELSRGSKNVIVAVIDSGIDYNHIDLPKDIIRGSDFVGKTGNPMDTHGHGTHVAGLVGALTDNDIGISGVNWDITLMAVKTVGTTGRGTGIGFVQGVQYAVDNGAKVLNLSFGGEQPCSQTPLYQDTITYAVQRGVVVVASSGNSNRDVSRVWPASCQGTIAVGATTQQDQRASFSNFGSKVDISAPGVQILSTKSTICNAVICPANKVIGENYVFISGTSMAAPLVSGVAALLLARNPGLSPEQVKTCIVQGSDPLTTDLPIGPRLNAYKALQECDSVDPAAVITPVPLLTSIPTPTLAPTSKPSPTIKPTAVPTTKASVTPVAAITTIPATGGSIPTPTKKPTPTPVLYICSFSPSCGSSQTLQLCTLQCRKK